MIAQKKESTCACGCGGYCGAFDARGRPRRFINGHNARGARRRFCQANPTNYPRESSRRIHLLRAERAFGKPLPSGAQVHYLDGTKREDAPLVICQSDSYHKLLHLRARVLVAGGDPNQEIICKRCGGLTPAIGRRGGRVDSCPPCNRAHTASYRGERHAS